MNATHQCRDCNQKCTETMALNPYRYDILLTVYVVGDNSKYCGIIVDVLYIPRKQYLLSLKYNKFTDTLP